MTSDRIKEIGEHDARIMDDLDALILNDNGQFWPKALAIGVRRIIRELDSELTLLQEGWQPIETAPRDGTSILLLSKEYTVEADINGGPYHHPARAAIGKWDKDGDSWCDQYGRYLDDDDVDFDSVTLTDTGFWSSGGGWFQPNEVTHWMPLPKPPTTKPA